MPNNLTDTEIKKALECCIPSYHKNCDECAYSKHKTRCVSLHLCSEDMRQDALDLINRLKDNERKYRRKVQNQKEELRRLNEVVNRQEAENRSLKAEVENYKQIAEHQQSVTMYRGCEIKRLKEENQNLKAEIQELKTEINMFRRYDEEIKAEAYKEFAERLRFEIVNKPSEFKAIQATVDFLKGVQHRQHEILDIIDNLLNELVGDGDER